MKKVVIISIIFALTIGVSIWEIVYSTRLFKDLEYRLEKLEESVYASGEEINNADTLALMDKVLDRWEKSREIMFCLNNHNVLRALDEKIHSLKIMIKINFVDDAKVMLESALLLVRAVYNDTHPVITNLF